MRYYKQKDTISVIFSFSEAVATGISFEVTISKGTGQNKIKLISLSEGTTGSASFSRTDTKHLSLTLLPVYTKNLSDGEYSIELTRFNTDKTLVQTGLNEVYFGIRRYSGGPEITS